MDHKAVTEEERIAEKKAKLRESLRIDRPRPPVDHGCTFERRGNLFIKSGRRVNAAEVRALQIIGEQLEIPVPRMHSHTVSDGIITIKMDFVEGETLWDEWPNLSADQKLDIAKQLRSIMTALRTLEPEPGPAGIRSCDGGPVSDLRVFGTYTSGPFADEEAFNDWIVSGTFPATPKNLLRQFRQRLPSNHRIAFAHGDLGQQNIIIRDNKVVALVDWEFAGWLPEYWDFFKFFARSARSNDWFEYAEVIFPEHYFDEWFLFQFLSRYQRP